MKMSTIFQISHFLAALLAMSLAATMYQSMMLAQFAGIA